ncbi:hypothetical protein L1987_06727 [Smallanthus sonchifolius]|uniref:Uncharacterized protein n=1 Tax=Smallanthus sonchifolius TaxID=185202 RepID=A0ACB9JYY4_9ASTR|nr:hypothetical protein L1987_06727 [Smallanthus sonchifolius]
MMYPDLSLASQAQTSFPLDILKIKKEIEEKTKDSSEPNSPPHQSSLITSPPRHQTPSPEKEVTTLSSRKNSLAQKTKKAKIISWSHVGRRHVINRDDDNKETFKCISDIMKFPDSDLQKITSLGIDKYNENESAKRLIEALNKIEKFVITYQNGVQEYLSAGRIVTLVHVDLQVLLKFHLKNEVNDKLGDFVIDVMHRQMEDLSSGKSSEMDGEEEEEDLGSNLRMYVDGNLVLKIENGLVENFSIIDLLCIDERSLLNLAELLMGNEEKNEKADNIEKTIKAFAKAYVKAAVLYDSYQDAQHNGFLPNASVVASTLLAMSTEPVSV